MQDFLFFKINKHVDSDKKKAAMYVAALAEMHDSIPEHVRNRITRAILPYRIKKIRGEFYSVSPDGKKFYSGREMLKKVSQIGGGGLLMAIYGKIAKEKFGWI